MGTAEDLARQLMAQLGGGQAQPGQSLDVEGVRRFLATAPGRNAMRGAVDRVVSSHKFGNRDESVPVYKELMDVLAYAHVRTRQEQQVVEPVEAPFTTPEVPTPGYV